MELRIILVLNVIITLGIVKFTKSQCVDLRTDPQCELEDCSRNPLEALQNCTKTCDNCNGCACYDSNYKSNPQKCSVYNSETNWCSLPTNYGICLITCKKCDLVLKPSCGNPETYYTTTTTTTAKTTAATATTTTQPPPSTSKTTTTTTPTRPLKTSTSTTTMTTTITLTTTTVGPIRRWMEYENYFSPQKYMSMYYDKTNSRPKDGGSFTDKTLFEIFTKIPATSKGRRLLEIGTGPSLLLSIFAVEKFNEIYLSDYSSANRNALNRSLEGAAGGFDWSARLEYIRRCNIPISENVMKALKSKVRGIYHCNVRNPGVITEPLDQADVVAALLCLEAATESFDEYRAASKNVCDLLKPSGYLIQSGMLNQRQYDAGSSVFQTLSTTRHQVQTTLINNGIDILGWYETTYGTAPEEDSPDDLISYYICYGVKRRTTNATSVAIQIEL